MRTSAVSHDAGLSMRLLRATNAASFGLTRTVSSVREALVAMGLNRLRQWVTLMLVADLTSADQEQLSQMLVRARLCQLLADDTPGVGVPGDVAYIGGLLSAVADRFGEPVDRVVAGLPLDDALVAALTIGAGALGEVLTTARDYTGGESPSAERPKLVESYLAPAFQLTIMPPESQEMTASELASSRSRCRRASSSSSSVLAKASRWSRPPRRRGTRRRRPARCR